MLKEYERVSELSELVLDLFKMLDSVEVTDNGREFRPTSIRSCRVMHTEKLNKLLPRMKQLAEESNMLEFAIVNPSRGKVCSYAYDDVAQAERDRDILNDKLDGTWYLYRVCKEADELIDAEEQQC